MAKIENTMECLDALIDKMLEKGLSKLSYAEDSFEITLEKTVAPSVPVLAAAPAVQAVTAPAGAPELSGKIIKSPIVGTYYSAPAPDKAPFVKVGQKVKKGDVLMIIESMKLMNEITSEYDGTVAEILICTGTSVEYDQPILRIE